MVQTRLTVDFIAVIQLQYLFSSSRGTLLAPHFCNAARNRSQRDEYYHVIKGHRYAISCDQISIPGPKSELERDMRIHAQTNAMCQVMVAAMY